MTRSILSILLAALVAAPAVAAEYQPSEITKVVILGAGTPSNLEYTGPATAVVVNGRPYLVDAGAGVARRVALAGPMYKGPVEGLRPAAVDLLFLTHLHSDHTLGLDELLNTPWNLGRRAPLRVYGPAGTAEVVGNLLEAFAIDRAIRINGPQPANDTGWRAEVHEFSEGGVVYRDHQVTVEAIPVKHTTWPFAVGYKFTTPDRTVVISGDTRVSEAMTEASRGADILVHEVYGIDSFGATKPRWQKDLEFWKNYMALAHISTAELAVLANEARPGLLVLTHQVVWTDDPDQNVKEIARTYDGKVVSARDLDVF